MTPDILAQVAAVAPQSALDPGGPGAVMIDGLWRLLLWLGAGIVLLVLVLLLVAAFRSRAPAAGATGPGGEDAEMARSHFARRDVRWMMAGGIGLPVAVLLFLFILTLGVLGDLFPERADPDALTIEVVGHQWWWEIRYPHPSGRGTVPSPNELHIPVGKRVWLRLTTADVIHAFWVPGLQGKLDMIPGRTNLLWVQADSAGIWRGQCAEFCGIQHARMGLVVVAEPEEEFTRWLAHQARPQDPPEDPMVRAGMEAMAGAACALCHSVRGTVIRGETGPDLTHFASRRTLAAATLLNTPGNVFGWVGNPQAIKPGVHMPVVPLTARELQLIGWYLASLD